MASKKMKNLGTKRIWVKGQGYYYRCVKKDEENDSYWIRWFYEDVRVIQKDGYENVTDGWTTVGVF